MPNKKRLSDYVVNPRTRHILHGPAMKVIAPTIGWLPEILDGMQAFGEAQVINGDSGAHVAAATASGWRYDKDKGPVQDQVDNPSVVKLRDNLAVLSTTVPTHPASVITDGIIIPGLTKIGGKLLIPIIKEAKKLWQNKPEMVQTSNLISKGLNKIVEPIKNTTFLIKQYGVKNPYDRKKLVEAIKTKGSTEYIKRFGVPTNIKKSVQDLPELLKLEQQSGIQFKPEFFMKNATAQKVRNTLNYAKALNNRYTKQMSFLEKNYPVLHNIAKESPQYTRKLFKDAQMGYVDKVGLEPYVKNLITDANTFLRRMHGTNFTPDDFLNIKGMHKGPQTPYELHVGNAEVVGEGTYGNVIYKYEPKNLELKGPVETWWSQRKPNFKDIKVEKGMHDFGDATGKYYDVLDPKLFKTFNNHLNDYLKTRNHVVFSTKTPGLSIGDKFIATPVTGNHLPYTGLGYKQGGKLNG